MSRDVEKNGTISVTENGESCTACHQYFDKKDECQGNYVPLTRDEEVILARMREVKAEVAAVKKRLKEIEGKNGFHTPREGQESTSLSERMISSNFTDPRPSERKSHPLPRSPKFR